MTMIILAIIIGVVAQVMFIIGALWVLWKITKFTIKFIFGGLKAGFTTKKMQRRAKARQQKKFDRKVEKEVKKQVRKERKEIRKEYRGREVKRNVIERVVRVVGEELKK